MNYNFYFQMYRWSYSPSSLHISVFNFSSCWYVYCNNFLVYHSFSSIPLLWARSDYWAIYYASRIILYKLFIRGCCSLHSFQVALDLSFFHISSCWYQKINFHRFCTFDARIPLNYFTCHSDTRFCIFPRALLFAL